MNPHVSEMGVGGGGDSRSFMSLQTFQGRQCFLWLAKLVILSSHSYAFYEFYLISCPSQWPRGLRGRSAAERLLGSWVRIPPGAWTFVSCECLCCQVEVSAKGRSLVQRNPTDCGVCLSVIK
jgi:hypothetical protein